jgi:hypothetical protein
MDTPAINPSPVNPPASEDNSINQEKPEKLESKSDDKNTETTSSKASAKLSEPTKKKFSYEQD